MPAAPTLTMHCGPLEAEFRPSDGGRLASLRHGAVDLVLPHGRVPGFYGDTFWPSPQSRFDWPPPPVLDAQPYEVVADGPLELTLRSAPDPQLGFQVEKRYTLSEHGMAIEFTLTNTWSHPQGVAPWQVTRAPREGLLVWARGEPFTDADRAQKQHEDPGCWFQPSAAAATFEGLSARDEYSSIAVHEVTRTSKFFTDAHGWLAHLHDGILFLRTFPDLSIDQMAPRQGEVELFFGLERDYIELENQGAYRILGPGQSLTYPVRWTVSPVDPDLPTDRITSELLRAIHASLGDGAAAPTP